MLRGHRLDRQRAAIVGWKGPNRSPGRAVRHLRNQSLDPAARRPGLACETRERRAPLAAEHDLPTGAPMPIRMLRVISINPGEFRTVGLGAYCQLSAPRSTIGRRSTSHNASVSVGPGESSWTRARFDASDATRLVRRDDPNRALSGITGYRRCTEPVDLAHPLVLATDKGVKGPRRGRQALQNGAAISSALRLAPPAPFSTRRSIMSRQRSITVSNDAAL